MQEEKNELRFQLQSVLRRMSVGERHQRSSRIHNHLFRSELWYQSSMVFLFSSLPGEPRTTEVFHQAIKEGKRAAYPRVIPSTRGMEFYQVLDLEDLKRSTYGVLEPDPDTSVSVPYSEADLVLVPGLGFDRTGARLGRGMAYYDHFLSHSEFKGVSLGICFQGQIVPSIPLERHDCKVSRIITENSFCEPS
ncbi:MAG: 5-formyltetrahydrofolate cyclo-ligase [Verrucomicrobiota bacterium]